MKKIVNSSRKTHRAITELNIRKTNLASSKAKECMSNRENSVLKKDKKTLCLHLSSVLRNLRRKELG